MALDEASRWARTLSKVVLPEPLQCISDRRGERSQGGYLGPMMASISPRHKVNDLVPRVDIMKRTCFDESTDVPKNSLRLLGGGAIFDINGDFFPAKASNTGVGEMGVVACSLLKIFLHGRDFGGVFDSFH